MNKNRRITETFKLTAEGIDSFSDFMANISFADKSDKTDFKRITYTLESVLLDMMNHDPKGSDFTIILSKKMNKVEFELKIPGPAFDPLQDGDEAFEKMRRALGLTPTYSYTAGCNVFSISILNKLKISFAGWMILAIVGGILLGLAGMVLPPQLLEYGYMILTPLSNAIFGLIKMASIPVIFLCTLHGIISCGDITSFGKIGRKTIRGFFLSMFILLLVTDGTFFLLLKANFVAGNGAAAAVGDVTDTLFSIFPDNIFTPFMSGDNVQIIAIALIFGVALLVMGNRADRIIALTDQLRELCSMVMQGICTLMPIMVFVMIAQNIWNRTEITAAAGAWKAILIILGIYLIAIIVNLIIVAKKKGIAISFLIRTIAPACLKGFMTGSSILAYGDMLDSLKNKLKVDPGYSDFSLPLGMAFLQTGVVLISGVTVYFAIVSGVEITVSWVISLMIFSFLYSIAAPPVSGGGVAVVAAMFDGLGVNGIYLGLASSLIMLLDYFATSARIGIMMLEIARLEKNNKPEV